MERRFYVLSVTSIFVALALGILMGIHIPGVEAVLGGQEAILDDIEQSLADLQHRITGLQKQICSLEEFQQARTETLVQLLPDLVEGRLDDVRVGIISEPHQWQQDDRACPESNLHDVLLAAGAEASLVDREGSTAVSHIEARQNKDLWVLLAPSKEVDWTADADIDTDKPVLVAVWNARFASENDQRVMQGVKDPAGQLQLIVRIAKLVGR